MDGHPHHHLHGRGFYSQPPPPLQPPPPSGKSKPERPSSLGSVIGIHPSPNSQVIPPPQQVKSGGKRTRWLLCYPAGGAASSESPSPPSEACSNLSTPSPTDHGFKIPNSQSNERPTSLPVALLNSARANGNFFWGPFIISCNRVILFGIFPAHVLCFPACTQKLVKTFFADFNLFLLILDPFRRFFIQKQEKTSENNSVLNYSLKLVDTRTLVNSLRVYNK